MRFVAAAHLVAVACGFGRHGHVTPPGAARWLRRPCDLQPAPGLCVSCSSSVGSSRSRCPPLSVSPSASVDDDVELTKGMPDKAAFKAFYQRKVAAGREMTMAEFMEYESVAVLLADQLILPEDVSDMWVSAVGDAAGLDADEAYEMLCMVTDLPDPEDIAYLDNEFAELSAGKGTVSFMKFLGMRDVQDMLANDAVTMEDVTAVWRDVAGDLNQAVDRKMFGRLNVALDEFIERKEAGAEGSAEAAADGDVDLSGINVFDKVQYFWPPPPTHTHTHHQHLSRHPSLVARRSTRPRCSTPSRWPRSPTSSSCTPAGWTAPCRTRPCARGTTSRRCSTKG